MATSPKKHDFGSPRLCWKYPTSSRRTRDIMNAKLRIQEEALLSKDIYKSTVSLSMLPFNVLILLLSDQTLYRRTSVDVSYSRNTGLNLVV